MVTVHIPTALRGLSHGRELVDVSGSTLRQVVESLDRECPGIKAQLLDEDEAGIRPGIAIAVNDELASQGLIQAVPDGGDILILPAMGGGVAARQL